MTMRRGRCNNIGLCENAARQRTIDVADSEPFACPKCGSDLVSRADRKSTRSATSVALPVVVIALAVAGVGYKAWDIYGRPSAAPAILAANTPATNQGAAEQPIMAPAKPQTEAAAQPAAPATETTPAIAIAEPARAATELAAQPASFTQPAAPVSQPQPPAPTTIVTAPPEAVAIPTPVATLQVAAVLQAPASPMPAPMQAPASETTAPGPAPAAPAVAVRASDAATAAPDPSQRVQAFLGKATRVPITFNFRSSVVAVTGRSEQEVDKLISYLKQHHATGERVYLAGFTDNQGDQASNEAVSQKRVAAVAAALSDAGITPAHVASFGSATPVADNTTQAGRDRNRRVEVYLAP